MAMGEVTLRYRPTKDGTWAEASYKIPKDGSFPSFSGDPMAFEGMRMAMSPALAVLASRERYLAYEVAGNRYNLGVTYGLLVAQLALGLSGKDRADILSQLVELLARQPQAT
jgi:hypothetical protein